MTPESQQPSSSDDADALGKLELPSADKVAAEQKAFAAVVAESPGFVSAVRKLARNTFRTLPTGHPDMEPVFSRKTGRVEGLGARAPAAPADTVSSATAGAVAREPITAGDRRVLWIGFALIAFALLIFSAGITMMVRAMTAGDPQPSAQTTAKSAPIDASGGTPTTTAGTSSAQVDPTGTVEPSTKPSAQRSTTPTSTATSSTLVTATTQPTNTSGATTSSAQAKPSGTGLTEWTLPEKKR